jgi:hypothetical protein
MCFDPYIILQSHFEFSTSLKGVKIDNLTNCKNIILKLLPALN